MRIGQNPAKSLKTVAQPQRVTVAIVTYIPVLGGYYAESLDVLKVCLNSLWEHTRTPYDLMVFDNGSCREVQTYLWEARQRGQVQFLTLSERNLGKGGAWNFIFGAAPGEVIAYADSDIFFRPGWLTRSLVLLETFPKVGMVTGRPLRSKAAYFSSTLEWARTAPQAQLEHGQFLDWETFSEHALSCGATPEQTEVWFEESRDWRIRYRGLTAYAGAAHFQFVAYKSVLQSLLPFEMDKPMGQVRALDERLNQAGYLRLMTAEPLVVHMGNMPPGEGTPHRALRAASPRRRSLKHCPPVRKVLMWLYHQIFRWYYIQN